MIAHEDIFCIFYTRLLYEISMSDAVNLSSPRKVNVARFRRFFKAEMTSTEAKSGKSVLEDSLVWQLFY
jgi:hypothetical protein